jgi:myo-inositol 2-dehydrogenase/D-chiro-inositol 1-dehydrogenase
MVGAGRIGRVHAETIALGLPDVELCAVSDIYFDAARQCADLYRIPKAVKSHRDIMEDADIDAIFICSSTDTHSQMIIEGAEAGKHIFCEKPIDFDLKRIDQALDAVKRAGVNLQIGFNRRFDTQFMRARQAVQEGKLGTPHIIRITSRDPQPPPVDYIKVSGGLFMDMTIHDFDMSRFLMGEEVVEVYATGAALVDPQIGEAGDIDTAIVTLRYENGAYCIIENSRQAVYGYDQRVEVFGTKGCVTVDNPSPNTATILSEGVIERDPPPYFFLERYKDAYRAETLEFIASIREQRTPVVTGMDGKIPILMAMAANQSLQERRPVRIETK